MDRNPGASQVATASNDGQAYGDLYQWGQLSDGHEKRKPGTTSSLSSSNIPELLITHKVFLILFFYKIVYGFMLFPVNVDFLIFC